MNFFSINNSHLSNTNGIIDAVMFFGLEKIKENKRLYFYKFDPDDVIEVHFDDNKITQYIFKDVTHEENAKIIEKELDFYSNYFRSAGLEGKRFLFDVKMGMLVSYKDFQYVDNYRFMRDRKRHLLVTEMGEGYLTTPKSAIMFLCIDNCIDVDNCILSLFNKLINVLSPTQRLTYKNIDTVLTLTLLCGLLNDIPMNDVPEQLQGLELDRKFIAPLVKIDYDDAFFSSAINGLSTKKIQNIIDVSMAVDDGGFDAKEFSGGEVNLSELIQVGLNNFLKTLKYPDRTIQVYKDIDDSSIISMYISKGAAFITPRNKRDLEYFRELFESENVHFVLN